MIVVPVPLNCASAKTEEDDEIAGGQDYYGGNLCVFSVFADDATPS